MKKTMRNCLAAAAVAVTALASGQVFAAGDAEKAPAIDWSWNGIFGTYDRAQVQRGFLVFKEVCASCHSLERIAFRNLAEIGYSEDQVKAIAAEYEVQDGPNDDGEFFDRTAIPADYFPSPFANVKEAAAANNGVAPPDLSLITKARGSGGDSLLRHSLKHPGGFVTGADYLYALLTGYQDPPEGVEGPEGGSYNPYFPGKWISMAQPLTEEAVEYSDGTKPTLEQHAADVTAFLAWASEPELEARKRLGIKVVLFLLVFTGMLYAVKRKIWADLH